MNRTITGALCVIAGLLTTQGAVAGLINGTFDAAGGWNDASFSGSASIAGGVASLSTGAGTDPFSAMLIQGDDGTLSSFDNAVSLSDDVLALELDVRVESVGAIDEDGFGFFTDTFIVAIYDAMDSGLDQLFYGDGFDFSVSDAWSTVSFDISGFAGRDVAISFELSDEDDERDTTVFLDNIALVAAPDDPPATVAEPDSLALIGLSLLGLLGAASRRG